MPRIPIYNAGEDILNAYFKGLEMRRMREQDQRQREQDQYKKEQESKQFDEQKRQFNEQIKQRQDQFKAEQDYRNAEHKLNLVQVKNALAKSIGAGDITPDFSNDTQYTQPYIPPGTKPSMESVTYTPPTAKYYPDKENAPDLYFTKGEIPKILPYQAKLIADDLQKKETAKLQMDIAEMNNKRAYDVAKYNRDTQLLATQIRAQATLGAAKIAHQTAMDATGFQYTAGKVDDIINLRSDLSSVPTKLKPQVEMAVREAGYVIPSKDFAKKMNSFSNLAPLMESVYALLPLLSDSKIGAMGQKAVASTPIPTELKTKMEEITGKVGNLLRASGVGASEKGNAALKEVDRAMGSIATVGITKSQAKERMNRLYKAIRDAQEVILEEIPDGPQKEMYRERMAIPTDSFIKSYTPKSKQNRLNTMPPSGWKSTGETVEVP